jgi:acyl-CoA thioesterase-1
MKAFRRATVAILALAVALAAPAAGHATGTSGDVHERVIAVLGDSLTAGFGVTPNEAYPSLLDAKLKQERRPYRVVNAGVSGDTSAGGLARVGWVLRSRPDIVIVALGANDGLRGQPPDRLRNNLIAVIDRLHAGGARVLLAGMILPPSYGRDYTRRFAAVFSEVGRKADAFMPFLLDGVATVPGLNQRDGIHPNAAGHRLIAERLWPYLRPLLRQ